MAHVDQCATHLLKELVKHLQSSLHIPMHGRETVATIQIPRMQNPLIFASKLFVGQKMWSLTIQSKDASTRGCNTAAVFDPGPWNTSNHESNPGVVVHGNKLKLSSRISAVFKILRSGKAIILNEVHFLLEAC